MFYAEFIYKVNRTMHNNHYVPLIIMTDSCSICILYTSSLSCKMPEFMNPSSTTDIYRNESVIAALTLIIHSRPARADVTYIRGTHTHTTVCQSRLARADVTDIRETHIHTHPRGVGTGPADTATARPIFH